MRHQACPEGGTLCRPFCTMAPVSGSMSYDSVICGSAVGRGRGRGGAEEVESKLEKST